MSAQIIKVDFKARKVIVEEPAPAAGPLVKRNKRLINDLKAMLEDVIEEVDLKDALLLIPGRDRDYYVKIDGSEVNESDIAAMSRIFCKMRDANVSA